jgi:glycosyltransferase involved in cell wall biosynthesis
MNKKKIIIVAQIDYPNLGSRGIRVLYIAKEMRKSNFDVDVVIPFPDTPSPHYKKEPKIYYVDGFKFIRIYNYSNPTSKIWMPKMFAPLIYNYMKSLAKENVNCFFMTNMIPPISLAVIKAAHNHRIPVINEYMDDFFINSYKTSLRHYPWEPINAFLMRRVLNESDLLWLISEFLVKQVQSLGLDKNIVKVPAICEEVVINNFDKSKVRKEYNLGDSRIISYAGAFGIHQGIPLLIEAFEKIKNSLSNCLLLLVGKAEFPSHQDDLLKQISSSKSIVQLGYLNREKLWEILKASDVLVAPQAKGRFSEAGFSTKFIEYLMTGRPVVASRLGEQAVVAKDIEDAIFFRPGDVEDLAQKIRFVLDNPDVASKIGISGRKLALNHFTPSVGLSPGIESINKIIIEGECYE